MRTLQRDVLSMSGWIWVIVAFGAGYLVHAVKVWLRRVGTPGPMPRGVGRGLSSY